MARTLAACLLPAVAISLAWLRVEDPVVAGDALAVVALAVAPALLTWSWARGIDGETESAAVGRLASEA